MSKKNNIFLGVTPCNPVEVHACWLLVLIFDPDDGGSTFLLNFDRILWITRPYIAEDSTFIVSAVRVSNSIQYQKFNYELTVSDILHP
jgi:hypothetical protein